jgi:uncharacterized damage-inducible protein DinB
MSRTKISALLLVVSLLVSWGVGQAQNRPAREDTATSTAKFFYATAKRNILRSAEKMPDSDYAFRPTLEVKSFGQLVAHVADAQYLFCSSARNEPNPNGTNLGPGDPSDAIEKNKTTKPELVAALKEAFAYCDPVFETLDDAKWKDKVKVLGNDRTKATPLMLTIVHLWEHYGNMVTYLRLKGIVPPSSEPAPQ